MAGKAANDQFHSMKLLTFLNPSDRDISSILYASNYYQKSAPNYYLTDVVNTAYNC